MVKDTVRSESVVDLVSVRVFTDSEIGLDAVSGVVTVDEMVTGSDDDDDDEADDDNEMELDAIAERVGDHEVVPSLSDAESVSIVDRVTVAEAEGDTVEDWVEDDVGLVLLPVSTVNVTVRVCSGVAEPVDKTTFRIATPR